MRTIAKEWLKSAALDLTTIDKIIDNEELSGVAGYHAQRAVLESFFAVMEEKRMDFIKSNDLILLASKIQKHIPLELDFDMLAILNQIALDTDYPEELGMLPDGKLTLEDARSLSAQAKHIWVEISSFLENSTPQNR